MPTTNLSTGAVKIREALEKLEAAWAETSLHWDDSSSHNFEEEHLQPIGPKVRSALNAINRLRDVTMRVRRDCEI